MRRLLLTSLLALALAPQPASTQAAGEGEARVATRGGPRVEAAMVLRARSADPLLVERLLSQQVLGWDPATVEELELLDLDGDGFGEGDLLRAWPGGRSHLLRPLDRELRESLAGWAFSANREVHAPAGVQADELTALGNPTALLLGDLLGAARRHLGLSTFELALDARPDGMLLRVWDYPGDSLYVRPGQGGGRRVRDVVQLVRQDTTYVVDRVLRDLLILESRVVDTLYVKKPDRP